MINDETVRRIALFFLFSLMDEKVALQAAHRAVAQVKMSLPKETGAPGDGDVIRILSKLYNQYKRQVPRNRPITIPQTAWVLPAGASPDAWSRFQRDATEQEVIVVVLAKILGFADEALVEGLGISLGTVRYRIGKGIRLLGKTVKSHESKTDARE